MIHLIRRQILPLTALLSILPRIAGTAATPPEIVQQPGDITDPAGSNLAIGIAVVQQSEPFSYQWRHNGLPVTRGTVTPTNLGSELDLEQITFADAGEYDVIVSNSAGSVTSSVGRLTVTLPHLSFFPWPAVERVVVGAAVNLDARANIYPPQSLSYQWQHNSTNLPGATNSSFTLPAAQISDAGFYSVIVSDSYQFVSNRLELQIASDVPPRFIEPPHDVLVGAGWDVTLATVFEGPASLQFQWRRNGTPVPGGTGQTLQINYITPAQAGAYDLVITSALGSATSRVAQVTIPVTTTNQNPADVDGDSHSDLIFQHTDGRVAFWHMNGVSRQRTSLLTPRLPADWAVAGMGLFKGDGHPDLLLRNKTNDSVAIWNLDGANLVRGVPLYRDPFDFGTHDRRFSVINDKGTGNPRIFIEEHFDQCCSGATIADLQVWTLLAPSMRFDGYFINNGPPAFYGYSPLPAGWNVAGSGDLDGDGQSDLVLQNTEGKTAVWFLRGLQLVSGKYTNPVNGEAYWHIKAVVDLDGDGKADIVFQHDNGWLAVWFMDGAQLARSSYLDPATPGDGWELVGPK